MANVTKVMQRKGSEVRVMEALGSETSVDTAMEKLAAELSKRYDSTKSITGDGEKINIPSRMSIKDAVTTLVKFDQSQEEEVQSATKFECHPNDGMVCFYNAIKEVYGDLLGAESMGMFRKIPGRSLTVNTDYNESLSVPIGAAEVPGLPIQMDIQPHGGSGDDLLGYLVVIYTYKRKYLPLTQELDRLTREKLKTGSIYKGKAVDTDFNFLDLSSFRPELVVYSELMESQITANILTPIRKTANWKASGASLKRSVLLCGPYGTGKTLTALKTAYECRQNGWTFIHAKPGNDISRSLRIAKYYAPAVVFFEDIDQDLTTERDEAVNEILNTIDGMVGKNDAVLAVMTTNHKDRISPAMLRPGRIDSLIAFGSLDEVGVLKLITNTATNNIGGSVLTGKFDSAKLWKHADGYTAAFIVEAVTKAKAYALARSDSSDIRLTMEDVVFALEELRPQYNLMVGIKETESMRTIDNSITDLVAKAMHDNLVSQVLVEKGGE